MKKPQKMEIATDNTVEIALGGKNGYGKRTTIDKQFEEEVKKHSWCVSAQGYAVTRIGPRSNSKIHKLQHFILFECLKKEKDEKFVVDHKDRNRLNNTLANLRFATKTENRMNSVGPKNNKHGFTGVAWVERKRKWASQMSVKGKHICLGYFDTKEEAAIAYNKALQKRKDIRDEFKIYNKL